MSDQSNHIIENMIKIESLSKVLIKNNIINQDDISNEIEIITKNLLKDIENLSSNNETNEKV